MVTTDISQLNGECSSWTNTLREARTRFGSLKEKLQQLSHDLHDKKALQDIEHLQNQFYIQLINIHDLKHAIREHGQIAAWEQDKSGQISDATWSAHEELNDQYEQLGHTLKNVEQEFKNFVAVLQ